MFKDLLCRAHRDPVMGAVSIYVMGRPVSENQIVIAEPVTLRETTPDVFTEPTFRLSNEAAEALLTELWNAGFRPRNGEGGVAQVEAMREHIKDLRRMAFDERKAG